MKYAAYPKYKPSGVEWLGDVPEHWSIDRLKWSITGVFNGIWGEEPDGENDLICVRVANFDRVRFLVSNTRLTHRSIERSKRKKRMLQVGDLLIEKSGGGEKQPVGCVVLFSHKFKAICSNFIARIPVHPRFPPRFWSYVHAMLYRSRINCLSIKQTTGIQNLDAPSYLDTRIAYPPTHEQQRIAVFLDFSTKALDRLVAKKQALIEKLKEKRRAVISRSVSRGLPPEAALAAGLEPHTKLKPSGIDWIGKIPDHWEVVALGRKIKLQRGIDITKTEQNEGQVPVISSGGVLSFHDVAFAQGPGVVVGRKGTAGSIHYTEQDFWPHSTTLWVKEFQGNHPRFVFYKLHHYCPVESLFG